MNNYILYHAGIKGQKWGVRRYQYQDGSLTPEGKLRYSQQDDYNDNPASNRMTLSDFKKTNAGTVVNGVIAAIGAKGLFALAGGIAAKSGKNVTAKCLNVLGDYAMTGVGVATAARLINNTARGN